MANVCEERVVIVANAVEDMAEVLEKMARIVVTGPNKEEYFTTSEIDNAVGDMDALHSLISRTDGMNHLCLFAVQPDTRAESGWVGSVDTIQGHPVFDVEIGLKWSGSEQPAAFCSALDSSRFGWSVSDGGEAYEWDYLEIDGKFIDACDMPKKIKSSDSWKNRVKDLSRIAYHVNLSGIDPWGYEANDWDEEEY